MVLVWSMVVSSLLSSPLSPASGERGEEKTIRKLLRPVNPLGRRPLGDRHVEVVDARFAVGAVGQRVLQIVLVVTLGEVAALMRAARLTPRQGAERHRLRRVEQI